MLSSALVALLHRRHDLLEEHRIDVLTERLDGCDDDDGDAAGHQRIFDRGRPACVAEEQADAEQLLQIKSRSIGMSGRSAGGIGSVLRSFGFTHFSAPCSFAVTIPSQRRQR
jgi:hypothetical protein